MFQMGKLYLLRSPAHVSPEHVLAALPWQNYFLPALIDAGESTWGVVVIVVHLGRRLQKVLETALVSNM